MRPPVIRVLAATLSCLLVLGTAVADVAAAGGATISGVVTDADGAPLQDITVTVSSVGHSEQAATGADGTYTTGTLPQGSYTVSFAELGGPGPRRPVQYWPKVWANAQSSPVVVSADGPTEITGIDAEMQLPASVAGTVRDPDGTPLPNTCVTAWLIDGDDEWWLGNVLVDGGGEFLMPSLPPARVRLGYEDCIAPLTWLPSSSSALDLTPGLSLSGVDGALAPGASLAGTVRDEAGAPLAGICVSSRAAGPDGDWSETASSAPDGSYQLTQLAGGSYDVEARPCDDEPYLPATVTGVTVAAGLARGDVDLVLRRATTISGTVRDTAGEPVEGVCVQVTDASSVRGSDETDEDGTYLVVIDGGGDVSLQFVDCADAPRLGNRDLELRLADREDRGAVDVTLSPATPAAVSGTVTNVRGEALEGVCVVAYLAHEHALVARTSADGTYRLPMLGPGTWAVAFFNCPEDDGVEEEPSVLDEATGVRWDPQWLGGPVLSFEDVGSGPDPLAAGATLLVLTPGADEVADHCFGCGALGVQMALDGSTVRAEVVSTAMELASATGASVRADSTWTYSLSCRSTSAPTETLRAAATAATPDTLVLEGVDPARAYRCQVTATVAGLVVAVSDEAVLGVEQLAPTGSGADGGGGNGTDAGEGGVRPLAFVG